MSQPLLIVSALLLVPPAVALVYTDAPHRRLPCIFMFAVLVGGLFLLQSSEGLLAALFGGALVFVLILMQCFCNSD